ncbi:hypothetical protein LguiB_002314 [Lonicera macranthoides]
MTLSDLIDALPINNKKYDCIHRLMRMLVHLGFFVEKETLENGQELGYWLTPASRLVLKDEPLSVTPFLQVIVDPVIKKPWHYMSECFQKEECTAFETAHGMTMWEIVAQFLKVWSMYVVDVGGGTRTLVRAVITAFPQLKCTVLDLPQEVEDLVGRENLRFVGGDMFEAIPPANAVLLKGVTHPGIALVHYSLNFGVLMGSEARRHILPPKGIDVLVDISYSVGSALIPFYNDSVPPQYDIVRSG